MDSNQPNKSLSIRNSPIEFVVVGSKGRRNGVLIRSENLKIDLIGFAARGREGTFLLSTALSVPFISFLSSRRMYSVTSSPLRSIKYRESDSLSIKHNLDERESEYRFCWVGMCSRSDIKSVRDTFDRYIEDLLLGLQEGDIEQVEWSISPVILLCSEANTRLKQQKFKYGIILGIYFVSALILSIGWIMKFYTR